MIYGAGEAAHKLAHALVERKYAVRGFFGIIRHQEQEGVVFQLDAWLIHNNPARFIVIVAIDDAEEIVDLPLVEESLRSKGFMTVINVMSIYNHYPVCSRTIASWYSMCSNRHALLKAWPYATIGLGSYAYDTEITQRQSATKLSIGKWTGIAAKTFLLLGQGTHRKDWISMYPWGFFPNADDIQPAAPCEDVHIGSDVWIGQNAIILPGIRIGDGAVIGAGAVVSRDVEPYAVVAGNPARHIRYRFPENIRQALLEIRWWDWPLAELIKIRHLIFSDRVDDLLRYARERQTSSAPPFPTHS
jgi:acetyltransferase-like isoleucine patch superfamily enzyme